MAVLSRTTVDAPASTLSAPGWFQRLNDTLDSMLLLAFNSLMGWLCRASRGYLCPPDMPSIMYPEERVGSAGSSALRARGCCDEKLSGE